MVNSGLPSLKRIRSENTSKVNSGNSRAEPAEKPSKLKFGSGIWAKLTRPFTSHHREPPSPPLSPLQANDEQPQSQQLHPSKWRRRMSQHFEDKRLSSLLNFSPLDIGQDTPPGRELFYEPGRLLDDKATCSYKRLNLRRNSEMNSTFNAQTAPATSPPTININSRAGLSAHSLKTPTNILVKRNNSTTSTHALGTLVRPYSSISSSSHYRTSHHHALSSSNITVNSEDLTAKEFADIAGIRILDECDPRASNSDIHIFDEGAVLHNTISSFRSSLQQSHARTMPSVASFRVQPQIWDAEFWQNPDAESSNGKQQLHQQQAPPLQRLRTRSNEKTVMRNSCVIKKGRFEICLETGASADAFMAACNQPQQSQPKQQQQQQELYGVVPTIVAFSVDA